MENSKKRGYLMIIGMVTLIVGVIGLTYAFFNYTRTGSSNTIKVGRIAFNTTQTGTLSLTNVFPMSRSEVDNNLQEGNNVAITITGDTTYDEGVEYLVTAEDVNISVNDKKIPVSLYITGTSDLGDNDEDYFDNRGGNTSIHKVLSGDILHDGQYLLVGYIAKGQIGVNGNLNIKAFIDKDLILISDTYDGSESDEYGTPTSMAEGKTVFTTSEWNSIQNTPLSFKVRVEANEGIWVEEEIKLYDVITSQNPPLDNINSTYVQNINTNSVENIKPHFLNIDKNKTNVIKLSAGMDFSNPSGVTNGRGVYTRVGTENNYYPVMYYRGNVDNNNVLFGGFCWLIVRTTETGGIKLVYNGIENNGTCLPNTSEEVSDEVSNESSSEINTNRRLLYDTLIEYDNQKLFSYTNLQPYDQDYLNEGSYMYGRKYQIVIDHTGWADGVYFGTGFTYDNGLYQLTDVQEWEGPDSTHHYSCNSTVANETCESIRFLIYSDRGKACYVILTGGVGIEEALYETRENTTDSYLKTIVDGWYADNLINYENYLEDAVWCDDRSIYDFGSFSPTADLLDGGELFFSVYNRIENLHSPSLICSEKKDRFTVSNSNGNGALTYPVGLLTADENILAGIIYHKFNTPYFEAAATSDSYLWNWKGTWTMSPYDTKADFPLVYFVNGSGYLSPNAVSSHYNGLRPAISLKHDILIQKNSADGTLEHPYVVIDGR